MANVTGTYTTGFKDENAVDLGLQLVETAYLTAVKSNMVPNYILPDAQVSKFYFKSGATTYNLDDIYVRADFWRQGNLLTFGFNQTGELGTNDATARSSPVQTCAGGNNWNQCSAGNSSSDVAINGVSAGIKTDGTLWVWGNGSSGSLGQNSNIGTSSPVQTVAGGTNWQQVSANMTHCVAVKTDGTLWTWGRNTFGELGDNTITHRSSPVQVIGSATNWKQCSTHVTHTAAVKQDGTLWLWGSNSNGQIGDNTITSRSSPVQTVSAGNSWRQVACGYNFTAATKTDNSLWCWGRNTNGQLGDNTITHRSSPVQTVSGGTNWRITAAGHFQCAAIKTDGSLWVWGRNNAGGLGDNTVTHRSSPVQTISAGNTWKEIAVGTDFMGAIKTDASLWLWGYNASGNLGDNTITHRSSPVQNVLGGNAWRKVSCGWNHTVALNFLDFPAGTIPDPPPGPTPTPAPAPCWVARLVYGETNPRWMVFRDWLLQESPIWFKKLYIKHGESFAESIKNMSVIKSVIKSFMDIIVRRRYKKLQRNIKQKITK